MRKETAALAVTNEVGLQPPRQAMLADRMNQPIGDKHEGSVGKRDAFGLAESLIEDCPQ
jgi:hypothetical protein